MWFYELNYRRDIHFVAPVRKRFFFFRRAERWEGVNTACCCYTPVLDKRIRRTNRLPCAENRHITKRTKRGHIYFLLGYDYYYILLFFYALKSILYISLYSIVLYCTLFYSILLLFLSIFILFALWNGRPLLLNSSAAVCSLQSISRA